MSFHLNGFNLENSSPVNFPSQTIFDSADQTENFTHINQDVKSFSIDSLWTFVQMILNHKGDLSDETVQFLNQQYGFIDAIISRGIYEEEKIAGLLAVKILQFSSDKNQNPSSIFESFYCRDKEFRSLLYVRILEKLKILFSERNQHEECNQFVEQSQKFLILMPFLEKDSSAKREEIKMLFSKEMESVDTTEEVLKIYHQILSVIKVLSISSISSRQEIFLPVFCTLLNKKQIDFLGDACQKIYKEDSSFGDVIEQLYREIPFDELSIKQFCSWNNLLWRVFDDQQITIEMRTPEYTPSRFVDALPPLVSFLSRNEEGLSYETTIYSSAGSDFDDCLNPEFSKLLMHQDTQLGFSNNNVIVELTYPSYLTKVDDIFFQKILDFFEFLIRFQNGEKMLEKMVSFTIINLILMINPKASCPYFIQEQSILQQKKTAIIRYRQLASRLFSLGEKLHLKNSMQAVTTICDRWLEWTTPKLDLSQREVLRQQIRTDFKALKKMNYPDKVTKDFLSIVRDTNIKSFIQALDILPNYILDTKQEDLRSIISKKTDSSTKLKRTVASTSTANTSRMHREAIVQPPIMSSVRSIPQQSYNSFEEWLNKLKNTTSEVIVERLLEEFIQKNSVETYLKQYFQAVDVLIEQERFYKAIYLLSKILPLQRQGESGLEYNGRLLSIVLAKNSSSDESKTALHRISDPILREEAAILYRKKRMKLANANELHVKQGIVVEEQASSSNESHPRGTMSSKEMMRSYPIDLLVDVPKNPSSTDIFRIIEEYAKTKGFILQKLNQGGSHVSLGLIRNNERMKTAIIIPFHGSEANPKNIKYIRKGLAWVELMHKKAGLLPEL